MDWITPQFHSDDTRHLFYYYIDLIYETDPETNEERLLHVIINNHTEAYYAMQKIHGSRKPRRHCIWAEAPDWHHILLD